jgi:hypothetical protein
VSIETELRDMAERLAGTSWEHKFPEEWTPAQKAAAHEVYERSDAEAKRQLDEHHAWVLDCPLLVTYEDPEDGYGPRIASIKRVDNGFEIFTPA